LTEISKAQNANSLNIFASENSNITDIDDIIKYVHKSSELKTCIFYDFEQYLQNVEENQKAFIETTSLIFAEPFDILNELKNRNLAHRLSLFIFFWNATHLPKSRHRFAEPFRLVFVIRPRLDVLRVYYNQATPNNRGELKLVNWYDANSLGLFKVPLLPSPKDVYRNFEGRVLSIPIIHSPPWHFVKYNSYSESNSSSNDNNSWNKKLTTFDVTGGRDYHLLKLIAKKMNFNINYVDPLERTQGSTVSEADTDNLTFSGALGKIQRREADLLLGDVGITFERKKAVEFSFFTLVDSGAFVTHSPRKLSEAFALIRPFRKEVWPFLILTVAISGPAFYYIIALPYWWQDSTFKIRNCLLRKNNKKTKKKKRPTLQKDLFFDEAYLKEMRYGIPNVHQMNRKLIHRKAIPKHLFEKCFWFTVTLFLKQSCNVPCEGMRAKFLSTILWLAATYVLADVYSAQLTSQLASPAREPPINTLQRLETAMLRKGYQLYVERQSSSLSILENSTAIFNRLYKLMKHQTNGLENTRGYLVSTVEEGIRLIKQESTKAMLGGRETLYFNMKRYGTQNFQLSEKLYTRYSAVAVQTGCPFLESLNVVLMYLFEGGILEKMTNAEYERMIQMNQNEESLRTNPVENNHQQQRPVEPKLQPINLRLLQGAFFALAFGYLLAGISLLVEKQSEVRLLTDGKIKVKRLGKIVKSKFGLAFK
ncbi:Ionotropic receptor 40a, partial [Pseudolycoriella hygida]